MADHTAVYDRHAATYDTVWDGYVTPAIRTFADSVRGGTVLDAGCGPGRDLAAFASLEVHAIGVDTSAAMVDVARRAGHDAEVGDIVALDFTDGAFAGVWASASLVHLDDTAMADAMAELARVTAIGGITRIIVKASTGDQAGQRSGWEGTGDDARWFRYWDLDEFVALLDQHGWATTDACIEPDSRRAGLDWVTVVATRT